MSMPEQSGDSFVFLHVFYISKGNTAQRLCDVAFGIK